MSGKIGQHESTRAVARRRRRIVSAIEDAIIFGVLALGVVLIPKAITYLLTLFNAN